MCGFGACSGGTTRDSVANGWRLGSVLRRPEPRVPTTSPSTIAEAIAGGSLGVGQHDRHPVAGLGRQPLRRGGADREGHPRIEPGPRTEPDQQYGPGGDTPRLIDRRHLGEGPADLLLCEQPPDRRGQSRPLQAARRVRPRPRTDPGSTTAPGPRRSAVRRAGFSLVLCPWSVVRGRATALCAFAGRACCRVIPASSSDVRGSEQRTSDNKDNGRKD